jgi:predicted nucleotidyltransferase
MRADTGARLDLRDDHLHIVMSILADVIPGVEVRAFGSRVLGTAKRCSDLDLVVVGASRLDWKSMARLKAVFEESDLPFRVDILDWHAIPEHFRATIAQRYEVIQGTASNG